MATVGDFDDEVAIKVVDRDLNKIYALSQTDHVGGNAFRLQFLFVFSRLGVVGLGVVGVVGLGIVGLSIGSWLRILALFKGHIVGILGLFVLFVFFLSRKSACLS